MYKTFITLLILICFGVTAKASVVEISVSTDKEVYRLDEIVVVSITAYNPNPEPVTISYGDGNITYIMDDVFNWKTGKSFLAVIRNHTVNANDSWTVELTHGDYEASLYPLNPGSHSVVGIMGGYGSSSPVQFTVVPEPATFALFSLGFLAVRYFKKIAI